MMTGCEGVTTQFGRTSNGGNIRSRSVRPVRCAVVVGRDDGSRCDGQMMEEGAPMPGPMPYHLEKGPWIAALEDFVNTASDWRGDGLPDDRA